MAYAQGSFLALHAGRWNRTKLVLRSISFAISIIIISLSAGDGRLLMMIQYRTSYITYDWSYIFPIAFFSLGIDGFELLFCFLWQRNPGIRPGWFIGAELFQLGGNSVALVFLSSSLPSDYDISNEHFYELVRSLKIAIISFVAIMTLVRLVLFVFACIETHSHHTAKQVQMIVAALRQQNMNDPTTAGLVNNAMYPDQQQQIPPYGYPQMPRPSHEPHPNAVYYRELPENQKFQGDIRQQLYAT